MNKDRTIIKDINQLIGIKVKPPKSYKKMRAVQLATNIGVSNHRLRKYEKGFNMISASRLVLIAQSLGEKISYSMMAWNLKVGL